MSEFVVSNTFLLFYFRILRNSLTIMHEFLEYKNYGVKCYLHIKTIERMPKLKVLLLSYDLFDSPASLIGLGNRTLPSRTIRPWNKWVRRGRDQSFLGLPILSLRRVHWEGHCILDVVTALLLRHLCKAQELEGYSLTRNPRTCNHIAPHVCTSLLFIIPQGLQHEDIKGSVANPASVLSLHSLG